MRTHIKNSMILALSLLAFACSRGSAPVCVYGDDFGDVVTKNIEIKAEGIETSPGSKNYIDRGWVNTGVSVQDKRSLQIATLGNIQLCSANEVVQTIIIPGNKNGWVDTGIMVGNNLTWNINKIEGTITSPSSGGFLSSRSLKNGEQLYMYVGNFAEVSDPLNWWGETKSLSSSGGSYFFYPITPTVPPDNPLLSFSKFSYSGKLYFRLYDHQGSQNISHPWGDDSEYSGNTGAYTVTITYKRACDGKNGQFLEASIGDEPGMSGRVRDMSAYAAGVNGEPEGTFNDHAWATGTLWLKIGDDTRTTWEGLTGQVYGDGDFTPVDVTASPPAGSNYGSYFVTIVTTKAFGDGINNIINKVIDPIKNIMYGDPSSDDPAQYGLTKRMYLGLTGSANFIAAVRAAMVLSIIFFALSYMLGLKAVNTQDFIMYTLKISFVVTLIGPDSWTFFYNNLFTLFINGVEELVWIMSGQFGDVIQKIDRFSDSAIQSMFVDNAHITPEISKMFNLHVLYNGQEGVLYGDQARHINAFFIPNDDPSFADFSSGLPISLLGHDGAFHAGVLFDPNQLQKTYNEASHNAFAFLNQTISMFFTQETNIKIAALLSAFPLGPVFILLIYTGMIFFLMGVLRAVVMYMLSIVMTGLLLFLAPIFITFLLFPLLRPLFDVYIKQLIGYVIQPVMMFIMLSIFNVFIYSIFHSLLSYSVCWSCVWHIDFPFNNWLDVKDNFDRFCIFEGYRPWGMMVDQATSVQINKFPLMLFSVLIFVIFGSALDKFLDWIVILGWMVSGGGQITNLAGKTGAMMVGAKNTLVGAAKQTIGQVRPVLGFGVRQGATLSNYISTKAAAKQTKKSSNVGGITPQETENKKHFAELPFAGMGDVSDKANETASLTPQQQAEENKGHFKEMAFGEDLQPKTAKEQAEENRNTFQEAFGSGAFFGNTKEDRSAEKEQRQESERKVAQKQKRRENYEAKQKKDTFTNAFGEGAFFGDTKEDRVAEKKQRQESERKVTEKQKRRENFKMTPPLPKPPEENE